MASNAAQDPQGGNCVRYSAGDSDGADHCCRLFRFRPVIPPRPGRQPAAEALAARKTKLRQVGTRRSFDDCVEFWEISGEIPQLPTR